MKKNRISLLDGILCCGKDVFYDIQLCTNQLKFVLHICKCEMKTYIRIFRICICICMCIFYLHCRCDFLFSSSVFTRLHSFFFGVFLYIFRTHITCTTLSFLFVVFPFHYIPIFLVFYLLFLFRFSLLL